MRTIVDKSESPPFSISGCNIDSPASGSDGPVPFGRPLCFARSASARFILVDYPGPKEYFLKYQRDPPNELISSRKKDNLTVTTDNIQYEKRLQPLLPGKSTMLSQSHTRCRNCQSSNEMMGTTTDHFDGTTSTVIPRPPTQSSLTAVDPIGMSALGRRCPERPSSARQGARRSSAAQNDQSDRSFSNTRTGHCHWTNFYRTVI